MPRRNDIESVLILGSGPIVIGQACEFDYSGTQACKAIREEGYRVILINSNPATIMTDPDFSDRTYIEPLTPEVVEEVIRVERPSALLPTIGGQTALNLAVEVARRGVLDRYGVELIGAKVPAIEKAEDREQFKAAMGRIGLVTPRSRYVQTEAAAKDALAWLGLPLVIRPSFTLGGTGGNVAKSLEEFEGYVKWGLDASPVHAILIEESVLGWKEFELEVMRDGRDNVVVVCSIENFDPMGVHTGDSITVAPAQTLTDKEYQIMRDASIRIIREIGVDTGGSNIQFAVHPRDGRLVVVEMNPRVSRSSALASKATGFPIAKIAAKLAVGYSLDEIPNDITKETPACFEPTIDYVVVKVPRFTFEKFPQTADTLTTQMKSVGEVMAIGRTFQESLQKAIQSLEIDRWGLEPARIAETPEAREELKAKLVRPNAHRLFAIADAMRSGFTVAEIAGFTDIDPWFLDRMAEILKAEPEFDQRNGGGLAGMTPESARRWKELGYSDRLLARFFKVGELDVRTRREEMGVKPVFKRVDTCAAEFEAHTPYLYSTYERECESRPSRRRKVVILGGGPNRIGQGIEFDYCCVHGAFALKEDGFETIMVNCNPETVSTDYDTSDRLYFEPLTLEHVLNIVRLEEPEGVIVQFGGQTPLKLSIPLEKAGVPIVGTSPDAIDRAEDRERFQQMIVSMKLLQPVSGLSRSVEDAIKVASSIGYPILVRPSYVLGGRAMRILYDEESLRQYMNEAVEVSFERPVLMDRYLSNAIEVDVDAVSDGVDVTIGGILEHIEQAGVHSGDAAMCLPPHTLPPAIIEEIARQTKALALELGVRGLINVQFAVKEGMVYILEVNPRASRTVPFVSKATGVPLAKIAARVMLGARLKDLGFTRQIVPRHICVKESVFPFVKFQGVDTLLGPEMKSTGEVMGIADDFSVAFAKAQIAAGNRLPLGGCAFLSVGDRDKPTILPAAHALRTAGFRILATDGTRRFLARNGLAAEKVNKVSQGSPHIVDALQKGEIHLVINCPEDTKQSILDSFSIRRTALDLGIAFFTTATGAVAAVQAIEATLGGKMGVKALQDYHESTRSERLDEGTISQST